MASLVSKTIHSFRTPCAPYSLAPARNMSLSHMLPQTDIHPNGDAKNCSTGSKVTVSSSGVLPRREPNGLAGCMQDGSLPRLSGGLIPPPNPSATPDSSLEFHSLVLKVAVACTCPTHLANEGHLGVNIGAGTSGMRSHLRGQPHPAWPPLGS